MTPREKWTDERLDDSFARVDGEIKTLRTEMNARFDKVDARFDKINERFEALNRTLIGGLFVLLAAIIGSNAF